MELTKFLFEIHGTEGTLAIVPADPRQETYIQVLRLELGELSAVCIRPRVNSGSSP